MTPQPPMMRIAVHDFGGYPFTAQLSHVLARRGHEVLYLHAAGFRSPKAAVIPSANDLNTLTIDRIAVGKPSDNGALGRRLLTERRYGRLLATRLAAFRPDVVLSANAPLDVQSAALAAAHRVGAAFVFWLQDIHSQAIGRIVARRSAVIGRLIGSQFERRERRLLRSADAVVAITSDFEPILSRWHIPSDRISVIENWAPVDEIEPRPKDNPWSRAHGLTDVQVLLYTGTLARKHDPSHLVAIARALPAVRVVVISEGIGTEWLRAHGATTPNLVTMPLQPAAQFANVLGTADVLLAILEPDAGTFSVPSKVLTYLAAGRPIVAAMPAANLAARTITASGAGRVVEPTDVAGFIAAARQLLEDSAAADAAGTAGRAYAERTFDIEWIADRFEPILERARLHHRARPTVTADTAPA